MTDIHVGDMVRAYINFGIVIKIYKDVKYEIYWFDGVSEIYETYSTKRFKQWYREML